VERGGLHSALREMQRHFSDWRVLAGMAIVAAILGFSGPFGTFEVMAVGPRLAYWAAIVFATYGVGSVIGFIAARAFGLGRLRPLVRAFVNGILMGPPVTASVVAVNFLAFGPGGVAQFDVVLLFAYCTVISLGISTIAEVVVVRPPAADSPAPAPKLPAILDRLPLPQRGKLLALSVADHYVEVKTDRGKTLVLIRLSDAIRETEGVAGVQIHRSHWVALDAVRRVARTSGKVSVELTNGEMLPVSRGYLEAAKSAGLVV
jgi:DNA-binding LytR/AlgR family response regulator